MKHSKPTNPIAIAWITASITNLQGISRPLCLRIGLQEYEEEITED
jgi:hypothetical protein